MSQAMATISDEVGDIDQWVADELGYKDVDTLHEVFMGAQVDGIAAAIYQISRGKSTIIADQTGLGKGREAAAIIRWAELHGYLPVFITAGEQLFSDMYRDLIDIGSEGAIRPFLFNSDAAITHPVTEQKLFQNHGGMRAAFDRIREIGEIPKGRNAVFLTYSQINTDNRQQLALTRLAPRSVIIMDESHNAAGGDSNTGLFLQHLMTEAKGAAFLSATWAKRPDNLPLYAAKTDISIAIPDQARIADAIAAGGAPLQAVVTHQLTQAGQHVRRERSFDGISIENDVDEAHREEHEVISDKVTEVLRAIVKADHAYHEKDFARIQQEAKKSGKSAESRQVVVNHMEFSSIVHNLVKQFLLALKAEDSAAKMVASIKAGERPIFALENTMGSFLQNYVEANGLKDGDSLAGLNYAKVLSRSLKRTLYYNEKDEMGNNNRVEVHLDQLSKGVRALYEEAQGLIDALDVDLPVSPIDFIRDKVEKAGHKIAEITGRTLRVDYSGKTPKLSTVPAGEKKDRVATASGFNNGAIDALILNQAGSTGISLHASEKFRDQRPRRMIIGQPAGDVNIVMQMLGRINRTGQVQKPLYNTQAVALPAEMRPQINLAKKMKSLNANVSSNTQSATSIKAVDLMNKYGDAVIGRYLLDNPDTRKALGLDDAVSEKEGGGVEAQPNLSMKATGRSALLSVKDQREFMDAISEAYTNYIDFLSETGQNDLEPQTYDYEAQERTIKEIYHGTDPNSPFGADAFYGEYSIKRQGKPFTAEEVEAKLAETFGPELMKKSPQERDTLYARDIAQHLEDLYKPYYDQISTGAQERAQILRSISRDILNKFRVGTGVRVELDGDYFNGIVTKIEPSKKKSGNSYALSSLQFTIAVNSSQRQIRVPGTELLRIATVDPYIGRNANVKQMFAPDETQSSRQKAKIITGNLLAAYGELQKGVKGRIIAFTMAGGTVKQGILMPQKFDPETDLNQDYTMRSAEGAAAYLETARGVYLAAKDGEVSVFHEKDDTYSIRTTKSKAKSGRFFLDPRLLEMVDGGNFVTISDRMQATVREDELVPVLRNIMQKIALRPTSSNKELAQEKDEQSAPAPKPKTGISAKLAELVKSEEGFASLAGAAAGLEQTAEYAKKAGAATIEDLMTAAKMGGRTMKQVGREVVAALYPRALADEDTKDILGRGIGHPALTLFRAGQLMDGLQKMFRGMSPDAQIDFVDRWQAGEKQPTEESQRAQELMQSIIEGQRLEERTAINLGRPRGKRIEMTDRPNYFPNRYKTPPRGEQPITDDQQIARMFESRRPLEGSKRFLKQQRYSLKEAVEKGAEPLGTPVDMLMRRLQEGAKFVAAKAVMHSFKEAGIIQFVKKGKPAPAGYVRIEDKIAKVWRPIETLDGGTVFTESGEWMGQEDAIRLLNNYLSKDHIREAAAGRGLVALKNATTEIRLSWSPFHWAYITVENWASGINLGLDKLYNRGLRQLDGQAALDGLADLGKAMVAPYTAVRSGGKMIAFAKNPDQFLQSKEGEKFVESYPDFAHLQELLFAGGLRWGMPDTYRLSLGEGFVKQIQSGHLGKATLKFFPWLSHVLMRPLFEHYIPRSKWTFAVHMLATKLAQYSYAIASGDMTEEQLARDVASATDNRFGEFSFENLYWNNTFKTLNQFFFRSVSWKAGTWLGAGKAIKETFTSQAFNDRAYELAGGGPGGGDGNGGSGGRGFFGKAAGRLPALGANTGWLIGMCLLTSVLGGLIAWLFSGKSPLEWAEEDHQKLHKSFLGALGFESMYPRTGWLDQHGEPVRMQFPTGLKDYLHAALSPAGYIRGSESDVFVNAWDTLRNQDAFGNYVYNPNDPTWKAAQQGLDYNLKGDFTPISVENFNDQFASGDTESRIARATGLVGGSPKSMERSDALNTALAERHHDPLTPEQEMAEQMAREHPDRAQILRAARERKTDYLQRVFKGLPYAEARDIYDNHATESERRELAPLIRRKQEDMIRAARR